MPSCYLTCPAYAVADVQQAAAATQQAAACCRELGWDLVSSPLLERFAGPGAWLPLADRVADWRAAAEHDAIWAFRGGYGAFELALTLGDTVATPDLIIGYSDITALHVARKWRPGLYAPVCGQILGPRSRPSLLTQWRGAGGCWNNDDIPGVQVLRTGSAQGPMAATCLRILAACAGTPLQPDLSGRILVIEDVGERPYAVDRDLTQLAAAGVLDGIVGLVGSSFPHESPADYAGPDHAAVLTRWADHLDVPALIGFPCGHDPDPVTLAQGRPSELQVSGQGWRLAQAPSN